MNDPDPAAAPTTPSRSTADRVCDVLMGISFILSVLIGVSMETLDFAIAWQVTDDTDTAYLIPNEYFEFGYWGIFAAYLVAFWGIHANRRFGVVTLMLAILLEFAYDAAIGVTISHHLTRTLIQVDNLVLGMLLTLAVVRLRRSTVAGSEPVV